MIEPIPDMPKGTFGFRVAGPVTHADMAEVAIPAMRDIVDNDRELRVLVLIEPGRFSEEPSALWEGLKADVELGLGHRRAWRRIAYVTDRDWIKAAVNLTSWTIPGEVEVFPSDMAEEAKAWVAG